ncbi:MAG: cell division/cell wall cluster transcriptional repressor MraZ [Loktanella sp.]|nr:cell division/cell wall cluster transcriptional repressor MraZ [Loktanella sp.]
MADCAVAAAQSAIFYPEARPSVGSRDKGVDLSFTGEHTQKVDSKGRMSIPADFRRVLEQGDPEWTPDRTPRMYLLYGDHLKNQLHGYTVAEFATLVAQINALPRGSERKQILSRLIIGQSIRLDVDKDGRTVMPIKQRQKLGITDGELTFSGLGDHFEIWKAQTYDTEVSEPVTAYLADKPDGYDPLVLLDG